MVLGLSGDEFFVVVQNGGRQDFTLRVQEKSFQWKKGYAEIPRTGDYGSDDVLQ